MSYIVVTIALLAALAVWWLMWSRDTSAAQAKLRKAKSAERARFLRTDPEAEALALKRQTKRKREFGSR